MEGMSKTILTLGAMGTAMVLACLAAVLTAVPGASQARTVTLVGAGDIAGCDFKQDRKTARLLGKISGTVFTLGDSVYPDGTRAQFSDCYDPTWAPTRSAPGLRRATKTTQPQGRKPTSITSDGVRGSPAEATTPTIEEPGTSWS